MNKKMVINRKEAKWLNLYSKFRSFYGFENWPKIRTADEITHLLGLFNCVVSIEENEKRSNTFFSRRDMKRYTIHRTKTGLRYIIRNGKRVRMFGV